MKKCRCVEDYKAFRIDDICHFELREDFWGSYYFVAGDFFEDCFTPDYFVKYFEIIN